MELLEPQYHLKGNPRQRQRVQEKLLNKGLPSEVSQLSLRTQHWNICRTLHNLSQIIKQPRLHLQILMLQNLKLHMRIRLCRMIKPRNMIKLHGVTKQRRMIKLSKMNKLQADLDAQATRDATAPQSGQDGNLPDLTDDDDAIMQQVLVQPRQTAQPQGSDPQATSLQGLLKLLNKKYSGNWNSGLNTKRKSKPCR